jgi:hypothetical protein
MVVTMSRTIIRTEISPRTKTMLDKVCRDRGMTHLSVTSRLMVWLAEQPVEVQARVLGLLRDMPASDVLLQLLAKGKAPRPS